MSVTDWIQALSSVAVVVLTVFLWNLARHQTELLGASVHIARQAAEAARRSAEIAERTLIGVQRPFLVVSVGKLAIEPPTSSIHFEDFSTLVTIRNIGREAAIIVDCAAQLEPRPHPYEPPTPGRDEFNGVWSIVDVDDAALIPPDSEMSFTVNRYMEPKRGEVASNSDGHKAALYLFGLVVYDDPIGIRRELGFTQGWLSTAPEDGFQRCYADGRNYDRVIEPQANPIIRSPLATISKADPRSP